jgi:predicted TIM-barrel fold metal-dependent hydrolase
MIIDFSAHLLTPRILKEVRKPSNIGNDSAVPAKNADLAERLKIMKKYAIDKQVLSFSPTLLNEMPRKQAAKVCRIANDEIQEFCQRKPDSFESLALVSLVELGSGLDEFDRTVGNLGFKGVILATNQDGKGLDAKEYYPFYERAVKYDVPIFLHPVHWKGYPLVDNKLMIIFGWPFDTTQAVWRIIAGGVLDRFPSLKVVVHHFGAMFPYFGGRMNSYLGLALKDLGRKSISDYWKQIYADTAIDGTQGAFMCGYSFFGPDRILFGTDYPFGPEEGESFIRDNLENVKTMPIAEDAREKILSRNTEKLLKIG